MPVAGPADPVLPLGVSTPFFTVLSCSLSRKQLHHSDLRSAAVPLGPPIRRYTRFARDATADRLHLQLLFLSLIRSFTHSHSLAPSPSFCAFSLTPSNFLLIVFVVSLLSLPPFSFACSLPTFLSLSLPLPIPVRCGPHALASPARATQHTWPVGSYLRSVRSYLLQGTVSRGPQAATARSAQHGLCSLVSRAHDTSQRRTERPDRQIAFSLPGSACGAFSLPLSLRFFLSFSPFLFFFPPHSLLLVLQFSPLFLLFHPLVLRLRYARDISHPGTTRVRPHVVCII